MQIDKMWFREAAENYAEIYKQVYAATRNGQVAQGAANQLSMLFISLRYEAAKKEAEAQKEKQTPAEAFMESLARQMAIARIEDEQKQREQKGGAKSDTKRRARKDGPEGGV